VLWSNLQQRYAALTLSTIIWFTHIFISNALSVLLPLIVKEFSLSYSDAGILATASLVVFAIMQLPSGYLVNRIGSKKILVFGVFFNSVSTILVAVSAGYAQFFIFNMMRSIGSGCHLTVATAFVSNFFEAQDRGKAIGTHESAVSLGGLASPIVTLPLALAFNWRTTYLFYGVAGLLVAATSWLFLPSAEIRGTPDLSMQEPAGEFTAKVSMLLVIMTIHAFVYHALSAFLPLYLSEEKEVTLLYLGYYVAIPNLVGLFGRPIGGYMSDKIGRSRMTWISLGFFALGIAFTSFVRGGYWLVPALIMLGFGQHSVIPVLFAMLMDMLPPQKRALIAGRVNAVRHLIAAFGPTVVGAIIDTAGFLIAFLVLSLAVASNFSVTLKMRREKFFTETDQEGLPAG